MLSSNIHYPPPQSFKARELLLSAAKTWYRETCKEIDTENMSLSDLSPAEYSLFNKSKHFFTVNSISRPFRSREELRENLLSSAKEWFRETHTQLLSREMELQDLSNAELDLYYKVRIFFGPLDNRVSR